LFIKTNFFKRVTDDILAMARPRSSLMKSPKEGLVHDMKQCGIRAIFNLQTRYEHKDCGDKIIPQTGFSYDPLEFTSNGSEFLF
jgi:hypothetical protein